MSRYIPLAAGVVLVGVVTLVHGWMTLRWTKGESEALIAMAERYPDIPKKLGDWVGDEDTKQDARIMVAAGAKASISRRYRKANTTQVVQVFLVCGLARDTAVHTPPACYPGQGYTMEESVKSVDLPGGAESQAAESQAFVTTFSKQTTEGSVCQRIYWMWNGGNGWKAPTSPRWTYRGSSPLNKLYLIASAPTVDQAVAADKSLAEFAKVFLPAVDQILYPPVATTAAK